MQYQNSNILILREVYGKVVMIMTVGHAMSLRCDAFCAIIQTMKCFRGL